MNTWERLNRIMLDHAFLTTENPVLKNFLFSDFGKKEGVWVIQQYFSLVRMIVDYLGLALRSIPYDEVKRELRRNIAEEQGSRTHGVPHRDLFARLLKEEMRIEAFAPMSEATLEFHINLLNHFRCDRPGYTAGMIYALEASAAPEFLVVARILNYCAKREVVHIDGLRERQVSEIRCLEDFVVMHVVDFEKGHEAGLRKAVTKFNPDPENFEEGFFWVIKCMERWWNALSLEE